MGGRALLVLVCAAWLPVGAMAQDRLVRLHAPAALTETGLLRHILPRFTLKTQIRVELVATPAEADLSLGPEGTPVFAGQDLVWHLAVARDGHPGTERFADWLTSEIGKNTVASYAPDGTALFGPPPEEEEVAAEVIYDGDAVMGLEVSQTKCTRCHVVDEGSRMGGIGSTPSFSVLRSLPDWDQRFAIFYALNPHPSFTQVEGITDPFPENRPPPIAPVAMTLDEINAVLAYVAGIAAADLGAPLQHQ